MSRGNTFFWLRVLAGALATLSPMSLHAAGKANVRTIVVDTEGGDFSTVAEANAAANPGDTIFVHGCAGEPMLPLKSEIIYVGDGVAGWVDIKFHCPKTEGLQNVVIRGFWVDKLSFERAQNIVVEKCFLRRRVECSGSAQIEIRSCWLNLVDIKSSKDTTVTDSFFHGNFDKGIAVDAYCENTIIKRNTIVFKSRIKSSSKPKDEQGVFQEEESGSGIFIGCTTNGKFGKITIEENIIAHNSRGVTLIKTSGKAVYTKVIKNNLFFNTESNCREIQVVADGSSYKLNVHELLATQRRDSNGNFAQDPKFNASGGKPGESDFDFSLRPDSLALRMGAAGGPIGASEETLAWVKTKFVPNARVPQKNQIVKASTQIICKGKPVNYTLETRDDWNYFNKYKDGVLGKPVDLTKTINYLGGRFARRRIIFGSSSFIIVGEGKNYGFYLAEGEIGCGNITFNTFDTGVSVYSMKEGDVRLDVSFNQAAQQYDFSYIKNEKKVGAACFSQTGQLVNSQDITGKDLDN